MDAGIHEVSVGTGYDRLRRESCFDTVERIPVLEMAVNRGCSNFMPCPIFQSIHPELRIGGCRFHSGKGAAPRLKDALIQFRVPIMNFMFW